MSAALDRTLTGGGSFGPGTFEAIKALAEFEYKRATKVSRDQGLGEMAIPRLLALAVMSEKGLSDRVCKNLSDIGIAERTGQALIDRLAKTPWYQRDDKGTGFISRPEPDHMAAVFLGLVLLERIEDSLPEWIASVVGTDTENFGSNLSRICFDLLDAPQNWRVRLETNLEQMVKSDPVRARLFRQSAMQVTNAFSANFAVSVLQYLRERGDFDIEDQAAILSDLGVNLSKIGRPEKAINANTEALNQYHKLTLSNPYKYAMNFAACLTNQVKYLSELNRFDEALKTAKESVDLFREFSRSNTEAFKQHLASALENFALVLSRLGFHEKALTNALVVLGLRRQLTMSNPETLQRNLAQSFKNVSLLLSNIGRYEKALAAAHKSEKLYRDLASERPDNFTPELASSLNNLANMYSNVGSHEEALNTLLEAQGIYRKLTSSYPGAFKTLLAMSLISAADVNSKLERYGEALKSALEARKIYEKLAESRPGDFQSDLAKSLNNIGVALIGLARHDEALDPLQNAIKIRRKLASSHPSAFEPTLASTLNNLANLYLDLGNLKEALDANQEALTTLIPYFLKLPKAHTVRIMPTMTTYLQLHQRANKKPDTYLLNPVLKHLTELHFKQQ